MYTDPSGHWNKLHDQQTVTITKTVEKLVKGVVKEIKKEVEKKVGTRVWATQEMNTYIENEAKNIPPEIKIDKNGMKYKDYTNRKNWISEQKDKVPGYVDALVAGDKYVDQENTIYKRKGMYSDDLFHGLKGYDCVSFTTERKSTAGVILSSSSYTKSSAITDYIVNPGITFLTAAGATKASLNAINSDLKDKKVGKKTVNVFKDDSAYDSAYKYMASEDATTETAALFILGMGLHTVQDQSAHGNIANAKEHTIYNDKPTIDSWSYDEEGTVTIVTGTSRLEQCEQDTKIYVNDLLENHGNLLFTPSKYATKK